jgi:hypothetical protein
MPSSSQSVHRQLAEVFERLSPAKREEVAHRAWRGDILFLPEDVTFGLGQITFPCIGMVAAPGLDPAALPIDDIELVFLINIGGAWTAEVALKTAVPPSAAYIALRKDAAFRSKSALDKYLRKASPGVASELLSRLRQGQIPFLPEKVRFELGRVYLGPNTGWIDAPTVDPGDPSVQEAVLLFVIPTSPGNKLEIVSRTHGGCPAPSSA